MDTLTKSIWNFDEKPTLEEAQKFVGGLIEIVTLKDGSQLVIDEEGKLKGKDINVVATMIFRDNFKDIKDVIVGDALILVGDAKMD